MMQRALREKPKRAIVKEELVALTGDFMSAMVLQQLIYWSERVADFDSFILEEREMAQHANEAEPNVPLRNGWIYKKAEQLSEETMTYISKSAMLRHIATLVEGGWVEQRRNPKDRMDRTFQYRVNVVRIQRELLKTGYVLEGYRVPLEFVSTELLDGESRGSDLELRSSLVELRSSKTERRSSDSELRSSESEQQYHRLLTEIKKDDDDLLRTRARDNIQNAPINQNEFHVLEPAHLDDTSGNSRESTATNDFAWKDPIDVPPQSIECAVPDDTAPPCPQLHAPIASTTPVQPTTPTPSAVLAANEGLPASPTLNDVCDAVDRRMAYHRGYWTIAKQGDYHAIVGLRAEGVPDEFILAGIDYTFEHFSDKHPNSFAYCAKIIKQLWDNEREKLAPPEPMDVSTLQAQQGPSHRTRPHRSSPTPTKGKKRDERYSAFYELFPDE